MVELNKYGEIGCPLWGMINIANKNKCKTYFVKPESDIFWGSNCKFRGKHCVEKLNDTKVLTNINNLKKKELDYLGIYNLLDHFENPIKVIGTLLKYTKSIGIITEKNKNGIPIQHHNILSEKVFKYISKSSKKRLDTTFNKKLLNTEYNFI